MQKTFLLSERDRASLVRYLSGRPYEEVAQAIGGLMSLPEAPAPKLQAVEDDRKDEDAA